MNRLGSELGMGGAKRPPTVESSRFKDNTVIDQIMLRFRPIVPRPPTVEISSYMLPVSDLKKKRVKRKYIRSSKKKKKIDNNNLFNLNSTVAMIEDCNDCNDCNGIEFVVADSLQKPSNNWISFGLSGNTRSKSRVNNNNNNNNNLFDFEDVEKLSPDLHGVDLDTAEQRRKVVESWITVETVTGTCEDRRFIGGTYSEIWKSLETDSCPGFVSNGYYEVLWVNEAYRRMLDMEGDGEVVVWLGLKVERSTVVKYLPAFSCRVRVEYRLAENKRWMMVPCDVWKMDSGKFAWLLDVRFALSLGPLS